MRMLMAQGEKDTIYQSHSQSVRCIVSVCVVLKHYQQGTDMETIPMEVLFSVWMVWPETSRGLTQIYIFIYFKITFPRAKHAKIHCKDLCAHWTPVKKVLYNPYNRLNHFTLVFSCYIVQIIYMSCVMKRRNTITSPRTF